MRTEFDVNLRAQLTLDDSRRVRQINHFERLWEPEREEKTARGVAEAYLRTVSGQLRLQPTQLETLQERVSYLDPRPQDVRYRLSEEKTLFDSTTMGYVQTVDNVPVWGAGITVTVKHAPFRVVNASTTSHDQPRIQNLPDEATLSRFVELFAVADMERKMRESARAFVRGTARAVPAATVPLDTQSRTAGFVRGLLGAGGDATAPGGDRARLIRGRFFAYRYDAAKRLPRPDDFLADSAKGNDAPRLPFTLPPVPSTIQDGDYRLVAEVTFAYHDPTVGDLNWIALVDVETGAVLFLRPLAAGVNGMVFPVDPITASGSAANNATQSNAVLNPFRSSVLLPNLDGPVAGVQSLVGSRVALSEEETPTIAGPTEPTGTDFDYNARTDSFAGVNAYYHNDRFFEVVESLGFPLLTYFTKTNFPVEIDHRGLGSIVNAHCIGDGTDGIDHCCYALAQSGQPVGIACDPRVVWHELGGHGILYEHVGIWYFNFCHSAGDSMAVIFHDPQSNAPDRFLFLPFIPAIPRRIDRSGAAWQWGGANDDTSYGSEEILATTLFRAYRSIGGDSTDLGRRQFASRAMMYLVLRAISTLTPATNPNSAEDFADALMAVDLLNWTSEGIDGGAYNKVIRWSFEKQGAFGGTPPDVDVYIDDGRAGEYPYQAVHWDTGTIWNRQNPDGGTVHEPPILGVPNYTYVRIKNRGTTTANNVKVKGFHCKPGAGLLWPNDLQAMTTAEISVGTLLGNNTEEKIVGPFEWTPITNAFGHDCLLMIASADDDPSNIDHFTAGETIPEWRLVPNDNNVGQRNVHPVPGGGGGGGLTRGLSGLKFTVGNPFPKRALVELRPEIPKELTARGWSVGFAGGNLLKLASGEKAEVTITVTPGRDFTRTDVEQMASRDVRIDVVADGIVVGGMSYPLDPDLVRPSPLLPTDEQPKKGKKKGKLAKILGKK